VIIHQNIPTTKLSIVDAKNTTGFSFKLGDTPAAANGDFEPSLKWFRKIRDDFLFNL